MYTEVYWAFNFLVNAVILWCACALCAVRQQPRLLAAAAFGACFATAAQYLPLLTRFSLPAAAVMADTSVLSGMCISPPRCMP